MTPQQIIEIIKGRMANSRDTTLDDKIILELNLAQDRFEENGISLDPNGVGGELPWFLYWDTGRDATKPETVAGQEFVDLGSHILRFADEAGEDILSVDNDGVWVPLIQQDYTTMARRTSAAEPGFPKYFDLLGTMLYFRPVPDAIYSLRLLYYRKEVDIQLGSQNAWTTYAPDLLINEVGFVMTTMYIPMPDIAQGFARNLVASKRRILAHTIDRQESGRMRMMGED